MKKDTKLIFVSVIGTLLEWAEYCIYGYLAAKISTLFFPNFDSRNALLATFGIFAAGYIARPLGGLIFGHIGDKYGRKKALSFSIAMMGAATVAMGLLPTYNDAGILAPILLLICRIIQGLAVSGEFNGAAIFLIEHAHPDHKNLAGSWVGAAAAAGMLSGALMVSVISYSWMPVWSWRIPFLIGALSCFVGFYLRRNISESPEFIAMRAEQKKANVPILALLHYNKIAMLQTAAIAAFVGIYVYVCNIYFTAFLIHNAHFTEQSALMIAAFGQGVVALLIPIMGKIADELGGRTLILLGLIGATTVAPMIFLLGMMHTIAMALCAQLIYALFNAMTTAPIFNYVNQLFPTSRRYSGVAVPWSVSIALFGGTAPMVSEYLVGTWQILEGPAIYVSLSAMIAFITIILNPRRRSSLSALGSGDQI
ncbi:MAG: MFS transporter [Pseudomonadota bacterium]|nr:MFS transporter [Pseudomonadota bacterium]